MSTSFQSTWDLDSIFPGGSQSSVFRDYLQTIEKELEKLSNDIKSLEISKGKIEVQPLASFIESFEKTMKKLREASAFINCLHAQDITDEGASLLVGKRSELNAQMNSIKTIFDQKLVQIDNDSWEELLENNSFHEISFVLNEYRSQAKEKLSIEQEQLLNDLAVDGYQGWSQMYDTIVGKMSVEIDVDGKTKEYSVGQAANLLNHPDRSVRKEAFETLEKAWFEQSDLFSQTLNHLAGFRLQMYKHRNWSDVLYEPLMINRMKRETLDVMWDVITKYKDVFVTFLHKKAELFKIDQLSIYDVEAPISENMQKLSFTDGAHFILEQFQKFSPKMAEFAKMAFEKRWIEAEDRANKRPGGFCTSFPASEQTRVFMTYSGTPANIATLAHELGHAYHQHVMNDMHRFNQRYAMNVAETASTFAEMIVADAAVESAKTKEEKITLLEDKIQRSIAFFMDIHSRFIFEQNFYDERKKGLVPVDRLHELMVDAQKEAYGNSLARYNPTFWASKLHFHITGVPFYNFPYTFGYLFSLGIYAFAKEQGKSFEEDYRSLLRDTGRMTVEDLAMKHLNVDLTKPDFWENALKLCVQDVEEFLSYV